MHVSREAQLRAKHSWTSRAVRHSGAEVLPMLAPTPPLYYRLRVRLGVTDGQLSFAKARSLGRQPISQCLVLRPELSAVLFAHTTRLAELLGSGGAIAGLVGMHEGRPRVQLAVELAAGKSRAPVLAELRRLIADKIIVGAILGEEILGVATLDIGEDLGPLDASADGFAQASAPGHSLLPKLVCAAVAEGWTRPPSILELYAGSGNLTRALLGLGGAITAVEGEPRAAARLQALADTVKAAAPLTVQAVSVEKALPALLREGLRADVIVLDPPRSGARSILPMLGALSARRIVYVSCDAMTLGRDLEALKDFGYKPRTVQPIDLMPHTAEVECVAVLDR
jgi:23S rRNA (uracil1939-C5)-methyltransferase